jgi:hypothetical protein
MYDLHRKSLVVSIIIRHHLQPFVNNIFWQKLILNYTVKFCCTVILLYCYTVKHLWQQIEQRIILLCSIQSNTYKPVARGRWHFFFRFCHLKVCETTLSPNGTPKKWTIKKLCFISQKLYVVNRHVYCCFKLSCDVTDFEAYTLIRTQNCNRRQPSSVRMVALTCNPLRCNRISGPGKVLKKRHIIYLLLKLQWKSCFFASAAKHCLS